MATRTKQALYVVGILLITSALVFFVRWPIPDATGVQPKAHDPVTDSPPPQPSAEVEAATPLTPPAPGPLVLIDDMANDRGDIDGPGFTGSWYTFSDETASVRPRPRAATYPRSYHLGRAGRGFRAGGHTLWGAGFGFDLGERADAGNTGKPSAIPFDASRYDGIQFDAVSRAGAVAVEVAFPTADTSVRGGVCDRDHCDEDYSSTVEFSPDKWRTHTVRFAELELPLWSRLDEARKRGFLKEKIYSVHFRVHPHKPDAAMPDVDVLVANVYLISSQK